MNSVKSKISSYLCQSKTEEALHLLTEAIAQAPNDDELHYLMGNVYRSCCDWKKSLESYATALQINPNSPAREAMEMVNSILEFYDKNSYNP